jgi:hypothetical protein
MFRHYRCLRSAADAWREAGRDLRRAAADINGDTHSVGAIAPLLAQKSPERPAAIENCRIVQRALNAAADGCDAAATSCASYAQALDTAHSNIIQEMVELGATIGVTEVVAAVLIPISTDISEAVSKTVDVAD